MATVINPATTTGAIQAIGTIGDDVEHTLGMQYYALAGSDTIDAPASAQLSYVVLGTGNDTFTPAFDGLGMVALVNGAEGNDTLSAGTGTDTAGVRVTSLYGGSGNDSLVGGSGGDGLFGDAYDEVLRFTGWYVPGDDIEGIDTLTGGAGDDLLVGGRLADSMDGGTGADMFVWESPDEFGDVITGFQTGASGDRLFFNNLIQATPGTVQSQYVRFVQQGAHTAVEIDRDGPGSAYGWQQVATLQNVTATAIAASQVTGLHSGLTQIPARYSLVASEWADTIARNFDAGGGSLDDYLPLYTLGGDDTVTSQIGGYFVLGDGNDRFTAQPHPFFSGNPMFADFVPGALANGGRGSDTLAGVEARDTLFGGSGADSLEGNAGADQLFGDAWDDQLYIAFLATEDVFPAPGNDTLVGGAGRDLLVGGGGADEMNGGADSDLFVWDYATEFGDTIASFDFGATGDRLFFGGLIVPQQGQGASAYLSTQQSGADVQIWLDPDGSGPAAPALVATLANKTAQALNIAQLPGFVAGAGSLVTPAAGTPVHLDPMGIAVGTYWADAWNLAADDDPGYLTHHLLDGNDTVVTARGGQYSLGRGDDSFSVAAGAQLPGALTVHGDEGSDTITGSSGNDMIVGGSGSDSIDGGAGHDTIYGDYEDSDLTVNTWAALITDDGETITGFDPVEGGADTIRGGAGNDVIIGGEGADDLDGGSGVDLFVYEHRTDFADVIRNFQPGIDGDRILINGLIRLEPGGPTAVTDYVSKQAGSGGTAILVDLDAGGGAFQPELVATLLDVQPAAVDLETAVLLGEEFRGVADGGGGGGGGDGGGGNEPNVITGTDGPDGLGDSTAGASSIVGLAGNDTLTGGAGNDTLDGGAGVDVGVYAGNRADYQVTLSAPAAGTATVTALSGGEGSDQLASVERLWFADRKVAIDFGYTGHAEITAKILGAVFGPAAVGNAEYAGIGLTLLEAGFTYESLMQLALDARLGPGFSNEAMVSVLLQNLGVPPAPTDVAYFAGLIAGGSFTQVSLAILAADHPLNTDGIGLAGLQAGGLEYIV